jgi:hypothetical protein
MSSACVFIGINRYLIIIKEKDGIIEVEVPVLQIKNVGDTKKAALDNLCENIKSQVSYIY